MKSERSAATDEARQQDGAAAGTDAPETAAGGNGSAKRGSRTPAAANGSAAAQPSASAAAPSSADAAPVLPPEPAGDAPGPVVDGLPVQPAPSPAAGATSGTAARTSGSSSRSGGKRSRNRSGARKGGSGPGAAAATAAAGSGTTGGSGVAQPDAAVAGEPAPAATSSDVPPPAVGDDAPTTSRTAADDAPSPGAQQGGGTPVADGLEVRSGGVPADPDTVPELVTLPLAAVPVDADGPPPAAAAPAPHPAPVTLSSLLAGIRRNRRMIRSRKVRRVVRHVDPWSVLTFSVIFHLCLFGALLLAGSLVWSAASASGTIDNVESFIRDLGDYETWEIQGDAVLRAGFIVAGMLTLASTILVVLLTVVFNLISDLIGGIRITVIEEEVHQVPVAPRG